MRLIEITQLTTTIGNGVVRTSQIKDYDQREGGEKL